ncbi:hypothetical protein LSH36_962g00012 [Paralvinella palmiformis]|uniref:Fucolectin tachylectin-4 pentraxin-1 domain-containing protein n=1 Tax=Paralvinella palmiformis TaxID=53620 RepID=A0AAD9IWS5_9ANNE|nr:hypothetical protein LSH36_962g00012 [Paralvinella palmiformis]
MGRAGWFGLNPSSRVPSLIDGRQRRGLCIINTCCRRREPVLRLTQRGTRERANVHLSTALGALYLIHSGMECLVLLMLVSLGCRVAEGGNNTALDKSSQYITPKGVAIYDLKNVDVFQGDYQDKNFGIYGTDNDVSSCFVSGTGQRAWWKIVLNETLVIQGFLLKGYYDGLIKFRVGKYHDPLGDMTGHMVNPPCQAFKVNGEQDYTLFECMMPMEGHVVSVEASTQDYVKAASLKICDVKVLI